MISTEKKRKILQFFFQVCSLCRKLYNNPVIVDCCWSTFCDGCIRQELLKDEKGVFLIYLYIEFFFAKIDLPKIVFCISLYFFGDIFYIFSVVPCLSPTECIGRWT